MNKYFKHLRTVVLAATFTATGLTGAANADSQESSIKLLTANFESRQVVQVEIGDFHFKPSQAAPIHTHTAPTVGYVAKGEIIYQIEGEKPRILREGDAFFRISHRCDAKQCDGLVRRAGRSFGRIGIGLTNFSLFH